MIFYRKFQSADVKKLRASVTNMLENMMLVLRTIEEFK